MDSCGQLEHRCQEPRSYQLSEVEGLGQECDQQGRDGVSIEHDQGTEGAENSGAADRAKGPQVLIFLWEVLQKQPWGADPWRTGPINNLDPKT